MKNKTLLFIISTMVIVSTLTGCGTDKRVKKVQKEYGVSKEEAETIVELNDTIEDVIEEYDKYESEVSIDKELDEYDLDEIFIENIELVKIKDEVKNAKITDDICQVYDAIIYTDGSMTLGEVYEEIKKKTPFSCCDYHEFGTPIKGSDYL